MTLEQLDLMLGGLPIDVSFVDAHDEVRFYSEGQRVFPRSPGVIGRKVQNCHPSASVTRCRRSSMPSELGARSMRSSGSRSMRDLHIRYFAMRDPDGVYRGVLETVQDVTDIRALQGQRRLLDW